MMLGNGGPQWSAKESLFKTLESNCSDQKQIEGSIKNQASKKYDAKELFVFEHTEVFTTSAESIGTKHLTSQPWVHREVNSNKQQ